jgi:hypothetical protein
MSKPKYDPLAITNNILKCHENIKIFEEAIAKERSTIVELEGYLKDSAE